MPEINGTEVVLYVNTGTTGSPTWTLVASQNDVTFDQTSDFIDTSSKESRNRKGLAGRYSWSASLDAMYVPGHASYAELRTAMRTGALIEIRKNESGIAIETSTAVVASLSDNFPDQGAAAVSISLEGTEGWTVI